MLMICYVTNDLPASGSEAFQVHMQDLRCFVDRELLSSNDQLLASFATNIDDSGKQSHSTWTRAQLFYRYSLFALVLIGTL